jgi:cyanophycin synthetase
MLASLGRLGRPGRIIAPELDSLRTVGLARGLRRRGLGSDHESRLSGSHADTYRRIWEGAALSVGAELEELGDGFLVISRAGVQTVVRRHLVMINAPATAALALDKSLVHRLLVEDGLPVSQYLEADRDDRATALSFLTRSQQPCVVKPASGTSGGTGVTCGVESADDLYRSWLGAARWDRRLLIERQTHGQEYRLLFLDGELLDSVHRRRPCVMGNGTATVLELIEAENERRLNVGSGDVSRLIHVDLDCELAVRRSGLSLRSVPASDQRVTVKSTVSENAMAENSTVHNLSPELIGQARRAAELLHLRLAGIDLVTPDPATSLTEAEGTILEVNATPGFHYHYQVSNLKQASPVAVPILQRLLNAEPR